MAWCPYHGRYHNGRVSKGICIYSISLGWRYDDTLERVMKKNHKDNIRKLGEKWSLDAIDNLLNYEYQKKQAIIRAVEAR